MLAVGQERVCHGIYLVVSTLQEMPLWVRHEILIIKISNLEVILEVEESFWDGIQ